MADFDHLHERARPGSVLAGKYRIDAVLGIGGMGAVVRAQHLVLDETVAIKFLLPELAKNEQAAARFIREAKAALRIKSDHVVRVLDVDRLDDGMPYIVMELLKGFDLAALLASHGPFSVEQAVDAVIQACAALVDAHANGIVHRDIKPGNLFNAEDGRGGSLVKVLDFGISKLTGPHEQAMTSTSAVMGSALYMSPEQLQSARDVDARCDIYALGVSLFELLSGIVPYDGETMPQLVAAVLSGARRDLAALRPDLPPGLVAVVNRAMATRRDERPASASELAEALIPFASPHGAAIGHRLADAEPSVRRSLADLRSARHADPPAHGVRTAAAMVQDTVVVPSVRASRTKLWLGVVCAAIGLCGLAIWALAAGGAEATGPDAPALFPSEAPRPDDQGAHAAASDVRDAPPSTSDAAAGADGGAPGMAVGASAAAPSSTVPARAGSAAAARGPSATPTRTPSPYTAQPQTTDAYGGRK